MNTVSNATFIWKLIIDGVDKYKPYFLNFTSILLFFCWSE